MGEKEDKAKEYMDMAYKALDNGDTATFGKYRKMAEEVLQGNGDKKEEEKK